jgi:UDP-N-acetylglucosamine 3-dehydrogenase
MPEYRVGLIGTGVRTGRDGKRRFGMNGQHASGYRRLANCEMVACADLKEENSRIFAEEFGIPTTYTDYREMLEKEGLDIVSISTWPHLHAEMTVACAEAGVKAIHCEKPMATTWGDCKKMARVCAERGVQLTFNHQRRFGKPARTAKAMIDAGEIGQLVRLEFGYLNLCDYGSHNFDLTNYFNDQSPAEWMIAQIDYSHEALVFGQPQDNQALAMWKYANGVHGLCATNHARDLGFPHNRLIGTDGMIEIEPTGPNMPVLRVLRKGDKDWETIDTDGESHHGPGFVERAIADNVDCLTTGREPELGAKNALQSTELIFAAWESSRRRGRVTLPLDIEDNPLVQMIESGALKPQPRE